MNVAIGKPDRLDIQGFLAFLDGRPDEERWELHDGTPRRMVGGTARHAIVSGNIDHALFRAAREKGCNVLRGMLVAASETSAFEPDIVITCGSLERLTRRLDEPSVVFEVHSPSTMRIDRGLKLERYAAMPALQQIVFVYQDAYRVECWLRTESGWSAEPIILTDLAGSLPIPVIGASLTLTEIYEGIPPG
jgi:Uma2 family endonuclease